MIQLVLGIIYGLSILISFISVVEESKYSEVAKILGRGDYIFNGLIIALIPVLNSIMSGIYVWKKVTKK